MKRCPRCEVTQRTSKFGPDRSRRDGLNAYCRVCKRELDVVQNRRRREAKKEWQRRADQTARYRGTCELCGGPCGVGTRGRSRLCQFCEGAKHDVIATELERLWAEGKAYPEIMKVLGWSKDNLSVRLHEFRGQGYDLPYRYRQRKPVFPDQVAA